MVAMFKGPNHRLSSPRESRATPKGFTTKPPAVKLNDGRAQCRVSGYVPEKGPETRETPRNAEKRITKKSK
ncbi:uncharacterized [Tachysurus ichikawai]